MLHSEKPHDRTHVPRESYPHLVAGGGRDAAPRRSARRSLAHVAVPSTDLLVFGLGVVPTARRFSHHQAQSCLDASSTRQLAGARNLRARGPSLRMAPSTHRTIVRSFRQATSISTVWIEAGSIHLTREREISHFEALAESRGSREMSPLRQSARVARGLSIEPSNIDSGEPPTSAEPRASPDRENCPLSEPLSSLPASGWSI